MSGRWEAEGKDDHMVQSIIGTSWLDLWAGVFGAQ